MQQNRYLMLKLNILIVEDSPLIAAALRQLVITLGHTVAGIAESYEEAMRKLAYNPVDMVITDIRLKGNKSGVDLGAYIKKHLQIPLVYQSSTTDQSVINKALMTNPIAYLVKPVNKADLCNALASFEMA